VSPKCEERKNPQAAPEKSKPKTYSDEEDFYPEYVDFDAE